MLHIAYYESDVCSFCQEDPLKILGTLTERHGFVLEIQQRSAWQEQIKLLQQVLTGVGKGQIFFEFSIPRMGKRADVVLLIGSIVFVVEFKVGSTSFDRAALDQVHDYALDLKNFHQGSHDLQILPILISTKALTKYAGVIDWENDGVAKPMGIAAANLPDLVSKAISKSDPAEVDPQLWRSSGYKPTPTIVEAAQALYRDHNVRDISRSDAGAKNLSITSECLFELIEQSKANHRKAICFVTGVPGSGKTLAGLNIATSYTQKHGDDHAVFLSGNGPLVDVLREALARDEAERNGFSKKDSMRKVSAFIQNIHHFRDDALRDSQAPINKVVVFDEAQRAWDREQTSKFMQQKRGLSEFGSSEPEFLISVMDRHDDWAVIICLIGGGQEINTGEAGLAEWLNALAKRFTHWDVFVSDRLDDKDYIWNETASSAFYSLSIGRREALHLSVSMRSFRAESLSEFASYVVEGKVEQARQAYGEIAERYPIVITRDLNKARNWLRQKARGSERYGLLASAGANRLRPEGVFIKAKVDAPTWFLNDKSDVRSSYYMEEVATEFDVQGLELDWAGVCWDADFRYDHLAWNHYSFRGTNWQRTNSIQRQLYLKNAYRVILTRARQGMVIFVPTGNIDDSTRTPTYYDQTFEFLNSCGLGVI